MTADHLSSRGVILEAKALRNHEIWQRSKQHKIEMHLWLIRHGNKWEWKHLSRGEEIKAENHFRMIIRKEGKRELKLG